MDELGYDMGTLGYRVATWWDPSSINGRIGLGASRKECPAWFHVEHCRKMNSWVAQNLKARYFGEIMIDLWEQRKGASAWASWHMGPEVGSTRTRLLLLFSWSNLNFLWSPIPTLVQFHICSKILTLFLAIIPASQLYTPCKKPLVNILPESGGPQNYVFVCSEPSGWHRTVWVFPMTPLVAWPRPTASTARFQVRMPMCQPSWRSWIRPMAHQISSLRCRVKLSAATVGDFFWESHGEIHGKRLENHGGNIGEIPGKILEHLEHHVGE